jgi:hypothetical protein
MDITHFRLPSRELDTRHHHLWHIIATAALLTVVILALLTGCNSRDAAAVDQAKSQAITTNTPQQVQFVDSKGNTVTDVVQPPATQGGKPTVTRSVIPPPPGQPVPPSTNPVITPLGNTAPVTAASGAPLPAPVSITIPAATNLAIRINERISVKTARAGDTFTGEFAEAVTQNGGVIIPRNTPVSGRIDESHRRGHFKGRSVLELRLTSMTLNGNQYPINTRDNVATKKGKGKRTAAFIGGMSGAGMLIGGIATGGVGLAIGGAAGAGAGTLLAGATGNRDITIPAESVVHFRLSDDLVVQSAN